MACRPGNWRALEGTAKVLHIRGVASSIANPPGAGGLPRKRSMTQPHSTGLTQDLVDAFVDVAHHDPPAASKMLRLNRDLAAADSSWGETALQAASHLGHRHLLGQLVSAGIEVDLFAACAMGDWRAARRLLSKDELDSYGVHDLPILHFGVVSRDVAIVENLLDAGVVLNPGTGSLSPLHAAVAFGSEAMIQVLLLAGADRSATDAFGA